MGRKVMLYVIYLPYTLEQYKIGHLVTTSEVSKREAKKGMLVEVLVNDPINDERMGECQKTVKRVDFSKRTPWVVRSVAPGGSLEFMETSLNAFPRCHTQYKSGAVSEEKFTLKIDSLYKEGYHPAENPFKDLGEEPAEIRVLDLVKENQLAEKFNLADCKGADGEKMFYPGWEKEAPVVTTIYKLAVVEINMSLVGRFTDEAMSQVKKIFVQGHQEIVKYFDMWKNMTMDDVRKLEDETKEELERIHKKALKIAPESKRDL